MRVVRTSAGGAQLLESRTAYMRYIGQGHEIAVPLEARPLELADRQGLQEAFEREYRGQFERIIPGLEAEVLSWALSREHPRRAAERAWRDRRSSRRPMPSGRRRVFDPGSGEFVEALVLPAERI